jgi:TonB-dependent receptor
MKLIKPKIALAAIKPLPDPIPLKIQFPFSSMFLSCQISLATARAARWTWFAQIVGALVLALFSPANAQPGAGGGQLAGTVVDHATGVYLEGAEVRVAGTPLQALTDRNGRFEFRGVPAGEARVSVSYPGLPPVATAVRVVPGETATATVRLGGEVVRLEAFQVSGTREGMAKAIALQKASPESLLVAASDQFGDILNGNVADYLKFLPGIGVDYSADDARALSLRGLSPSLTAVTMDNNPIASASSGGTERRFEFEQISVSNVETIEVFKTLTPDKPATNAGGSVNLVTKSAFDRRDTLIRYRFYGATPGWHHATSLRDISPMTGERTSMTRPNAELDVTARVNENLGFYVGVRNYENIRTMERSAYVYTFNPATGGLPNDPAPTEWNFFTDYAMNTRRSASARVDWRAGPRTVVSAGGSWNWFDMPFSHHLYASIFSNRPSLALGQAPAHTVSTGASSGTGRLLNRLTQRRKSGTTYTFNVSLKHDFAAGLKLQAGLYWNKADNRYSDISEGYFGQVDANLANVALRIANLGAVVPEVTATVAGAPVLRSDLSRFNISRMFTLQRSAWDTREGATVELSRPFTVAGVPFVARIGGSNDAKLRKSEQFNRRTPTDPTVPAGGIAPLIDNIWSAASAPLGMPGTVAWVNMKRAYEVYGHLPRQVYENDVLMQFDETARAAYARFDLKPRSDLLIVTGLRHERIEAENQNRFLRATGTFRHRDEYFSLNAKYTPAANHVFRVAMAESIGLPNYGDMLPGTLTITDPTPAGVRGRVSLTNPALRPYRVDNYDLGYEFHFRHAGMLGASLFRKDFGNYIISATRSLTPEMAAELGLDDGSFVGAPSDYDVVTRFNVPERGRYQGLELVYSQTLGFLPGALKSLALQLNATFIDVSPIRTRQVLVAGNPAQDASIVEQVAYALETNAVTRQYNAALSWRHRGLSVLATLNHAGRTLKGVSRTDVRYTGGALQYQNNLSHMTPRTTVDLRLDYAYSRRLVPFLQVRNVFNASIENTQNGYLLNTQDFLDPKLEFGLRGTW